MKKLKWYFKNGTMFEVFSVLYEDDNYILVKNDETEKLSYGLKKDFGTLYGFPVNQSCLTNCECVSMLNAFIEIDKKYIDSLGEYSRDKIIIFI
jgi:hypothetical protein